MLTGHRDRSPCPAREWLAPLPQSQAKTRCSPVCIHRERIVASARRSRGAAPAQFLRTYLQNITRHRALKWRSMELSESSLAIYQGRAKPLRLGGRLVCWDTTFGGGEYPKRRHP